MALEKLPLLALVAVSCVTTVWAQRAALAPIKELPMWWRIGNALISYVAYLGQFFYPAGLAVFYPRSGLDLPLWKVLGAALVLLGITGGVVVLRRRCPYLLVGWLWYVGMLVPVIGIVQVGSQMMADRFTYLPQIGPCIALTWGLADVRRFLAVSSPAVGRRERRCAGVFDGLRVASDNVLAGQRDPLDPRPRL